MSQVKKVELPNLRKLVPSPSVNPLMQPSSIEIKRRRVRSGVKKDFMDPETGEISATSMVHTIEDKDDKEFVKVFADGFKAAYDLSRTAYRVFQAILEAYQKEKMTGGYADSVRLFWFDDGLNGEAIGMSEKTFQRGLKELIAKQFLYPRTNELYWVNPVMFFKGDRVAFIREYRLKSPEPKQTDLEDFTS